MLLGISGTERGNILETKGMSLQRTARTGAFEIYRGINEFKKGYQPRTNIMKDENGDLLADSRNILNRWKNYCCWLLNVHRGSDVRQIEIHMWERV
jgi:hypothetical protein